MRKILETTKENLTIFKKIEKLSLALLKSHGQSERANHDRAELCQPAKNKNRLYPRVDQKAADTYLKMY